MNRETYAHRLGRKAFYAEAGRSGNRKGHNVVEYTYAKELAERLDTALHALGIIEGAAACGKKCTAKQPERTEAYRND